MPFSSRPRTTLLILLACLSACSGGDIQVPATSKTSASVLRQGMPMTPDAYRSTVQQIYVAYFGRPADVDGLAYFEGLLSNFSAPLAVGDLVAEYGRNENIRKLIDTFSNSQESQALYGGDDAAFIDAIYKNLFNRAADADGKAYWAGLLQSKAMTRGNAAMAILAGAQGSDAGIIAQKTQVAINFSAALDEDPKKQAYAGMVANAVVRTMLWGVGASTDPTAFQPQVTSTIQKLVETQAQNAGGTNPNSIVFSVSYDRSAVYRDEIGKTPITAEVRAYLHSGHHLILSWTGKDASTKELKTRQVELTDDGNGGDRVAHDGIYTARVVYDLLPRNEYMGIANYSAKISVLNTDGSTAPSNVGDIKTENSFVIVDRSATPAITKVADDVYASGSVVNIVLPSAFSNESDAATAFKRMLDFWPDVFDEAAFFYAGQTGPKVDTEYSYHVFNDVQGIGIGASDSRAQWGNTKTLRHVSQLTGGTTGPFMHEFTHRWGFMLNDARLHLAEYTSCACHFHMYTQMNWDPISAGGGVGLVKQANGDWKFDHLSNPDYTHSDMMLYLMGLIAPGDLPAQAWVVNQDWQTPLGSVIPANHVTMIGAPEIEAVYGKRTPAFGGAPSSFRLAAVVITRGRAALPEEMSAVQAQMNFYSAPDKGQQADSEGGWHWGLPFHASTKNHGTLVTTLPARK